MPYEVIAKDFSPTELAEAGGSVVVRRELVKDLLHSKFLESILDGREYTVHFHASTSPSERGESITVAGSWTLIDAGQAKLGEDVHAKAIPLGFQYDEGQKADYAGRSFIKTDWGWHCTGVRPT